MMYVPGDETIDLDSDIVESKTSASGGISDFLQEQTSTSQPTHHRNHHSSKTTTSEASLDAFWPNIQEDVKRIRHVDAKNQVLPLARIKKIMKLDENAKMIAAEAPLLFAKAAEIFIQELTLRAWIHTEENKRRTLQRNDIAKAIAKCDQFDFLIDIVPREEVPAQKPPDRKEAHETSTSMAKATTAVSNTATGSGLTDQVQYYLQLAQQHQQALQNAPTTVNIINSGNSGNSGLGGVTLGTPQNIILSTGNTGQATNTQQTILNSLQAPQQQIQLLQQVVTPTGEITHVPVTITQNQLNLLRMQMQANAAVAPNTTANQTQQIQIIGTHPQLVQVAGQPTTTQSIFINTGQSAVGGSHGGVQQQQATASGSNTSDDKRNSLSNSFRQNC